MIDPGRWRKRLVLGLALWASLPSLQWCPFTWESCRKACAAGGAAPMRTMACGPMAAATCDPGEAQACAARGASCDRTCDRRPKPAPFRDCAWCIRSPIDGVPVRGLDLASRVAGPLLYAAIEAPRLRPPAPSTRERLESTTACPAHRAAHAPPQCRAPPSA